MKFLRLVITAVIGGCALLSGAATTPARAAEVGVPVVDMPAGVVRGAREGDANVFRAIPYAMPPVGERRWRPPAPMPRWAGVRPAEQVGVACMQPAMAAGPYNRGPQPMGEDCLTLDITAPADARNAPVMVWIHGGTPDLGNRAFAHV